jgi:hypothetical protein
MQTEDRINILETQVRSLKRIVCLVCCLLVAGVAISATQSQGVPDVIQAKSFNVVNNDGTALVHLGTSTAGLGMITTMNNRGQEIVRLGVTVSGKGIVKTMNGNGEALVQLSVNTDGQGVIRTWNGDGQPLVVLGGGRSDQGSQGGVWCFDNDGLATSSLP